MRSPKILSVLFCSVTLQALKKSYEEASLNIHFDQLLIFCVPRTHRDRGACLTVFILSTFFQNSVKEFIHVVVSQFQFQNWDSQRDQPYLSLVLQAVRPRLKGVWPRLKDGLVRQETRFLAPILTELASLSRLLRQAEIYFGGILQPASRTGNLRGQKIFLRQFFFLSRLEYILTKHKF